MDDEYTRVATTLCWACTGRLAPVDCPGELLVAALAAHRICGRFLRRAAGADARIPEAVLDEVRRVERAHLDAADAVERDANRLADAITRHPAWDRMPFVVLKGNAASHLTRPAGSRRGTGDIDLLTSDPVRYQGMLESVGYRPDGDNFGGHEAANLRSPDHHDVDLHRYCPSWRMPSGSYRGWSPDGGELHMTDWIRCDRLDYDAVVEGSVAHPAGSSPWLRMPDATTSALIICLEVFRDYVANNEEMATVRLSDLCEVVELRNSDGFDVARFAELVRRCRAHDSVALTSHLVDQLFGHVDHLRLGVTGAASYPQMLGIGQLFETEPRLFDLLLRRDSFGGSLRHLTPNELGPRDLPATIEVRGTGVSLNGRRARATRSVPPARDRDGDVEFDCRISVRDNGVELDIHGLHPPGPFREIVKVVCRHGLVVTGYDGYRSGVRYPSPTSNCSVAWRVGTDGWNVRIELPRTILATSPVTAVPVLVHCCRFLAPPSDSWDDYYRRRVSSVSVPVLLPA